MMMKRNGANGSARRRSGGLSAATIETILESIRHSERAIALLQQILADNDAADSVEMSWRHAQPLH
jgi:hypothetical protein